jgi:hypothetical protein
MTTLQDAELGYKLVHMEVTLIEVLSTYRLSAKYMHLWSDNAYKMHHIFTRENNCIWANKISQYMQLNIQV